MFKLRVTKNQLPEPWNVTYEGEVACVHNGLIRPDQIDEYKKTYMKEILKKIESMGASDITESDVVFSEEEVDAE